MIMIVVLAICVLVLVSQTIPGAFGERVGAPSDSSAIASLMASRHAIASRACSSELIRMGATSDTTVCPLSASDLAAATPTWATATNAPIASVAVFAEGRSIVVTYPTAGLRWAATDVGRLTAALRRGDRDTGIGLGRHQGAGRVTVEGVSLWDPTGTGATRVPNSLSVDVPALSGIPRHAPVLVTRM